MNVTLFVVELAIDSVFNKIFEEVFNSNLHLRFFFGFYLTWVIFGYVPTVDVAVIEDLPECALFIWNRILEKWWGFQMSGELFEGYRVGANLI